MPFLDACAPTWRDDSRLSEVRRWPCPSRSSQAWAATCQDHIPGGWTGRADLSHIRTQDLAPHSVPSGTDSSACAGFLPSGPSLPLPQSGAATLRSRTAHRAPAVNEGPYCAQGAHRPRWWKSFSEVPRKQADRHFLFFTLKRFVSFRERECVCASRAGAAHSPQSPSVGLDLTTPRWCPEPESRVECLTDGASQADGHLD